MARVRLNRGHAREMTKSQEVFAKRKAGQIDEAYRMALELVNENENDEWNLKALAWCLIDLIKRDSQANCQTHLANYAHQLQSIKIDEHDEILGNQAKFALSLCNPNGQLIQQARALSKQGNHLQAANIYRQLCSAGAGDQNVQTSLGWELFRLLQQSLAQEHINVSKSKRLLADYLKLQQIEKPSQLHSSILQLASRLAGNSSFSLISFTQYWQLDFLREEDYQPYVNSQGDKYPSLAEKVIQQAAKESIVADNRDQINYILPYLDNAIKRFPENIWLVLNKAKALLKLGQNDQALSFATEVTRSKVNDYWAWALLGDVNAELDEQVALSCYCKALLCHTEDKFTAKVRIKLARSLAALGEFSEAKYEVERVNASKAKEGVKIPEEVEKLQQSEWYHAFPATESNKGYYKQNIAKAEELLFSHLPFVKACVGAKFTIPDKPNKPKRKLYLKLPGKSDPFEISVPEHKYHFGAEGTGLCIKGDFDTNGRYQVYLIEDRNCEESWDIFSEHVGVIDHVNHQKRVVHFIVSRAISGVIPFSDINGKVHEGDAVAVTVAQFESKRGPGHRVLSACLTSEPPNSSVYKEFSQYVSESNGMGFTDDDIFISRPLMSKYDVKDGDVVEGMAVLNYEKRKMRWGWKALKITSVD